MSSARSILTILWFAASGSEPESYLGIHTAIPAFADEDLAPDPDAAPGLTITAVAENSPGEAAGIRVGDVLLRIDGIAPRTPGQLEALVAARPPGSEVRLESRRGDDLIDIRAFTVPRLVPRQQAGGRRILEARRLGLALETLDGDESRRAGLAPGDGLRVRRILAGSPLEGRGLEPGDVVVSVAGSKVHGADDFLSIARGLAPGQRIEIAALRAGEPRTIQVRARKPGSHIAYFHFPGLVIYERDPRKEETTFGLILNVFKYTRRESRRTYRFLWLISLTTGTNEVLEEVRE